MEALCRLERDLETVTSRLRQASAEAWNGDGRPTFFAQRILCRRLAGAFDRSVVAEHLIRRPLDDDPEPARRFSRQSARSRFVRRVLEALPDGHRPSEEWVRRELKKRR